MCALKLCRWMSETRWRVYTRSVYCRDNLGNCVNTGKTWASLEGDQCWTRKCSITGSNSVQVISKSGGDCFEKFVNPKINKKDIKNDIKFEFSRAQLPYYLSEQRYKLSHTKSLENPLGGRSTFAIAIRVNIRLRKQMKKSDDGIVHWYPIFHTD
ncbi:uncharacterized protein LOC118763783 [Octopus sinensis]|uniref:Uncharacterized protein LOC118763783 n=1 Tax=Octopus sinensis TaxID=2607531 RepID=A0A7E6EXD1_9MOLL|nr:uncharacterized protein LOC118763783 [Octopus sinensis]